MLIDGHWMPEGIEFTADVCVIGAGPNGVTVAQRLAESALDVCLVESGGLDEEPEAQDLNRGDIVGLPYYALERTSFRLLGGSSNRWGGWCRPLDREDFSPRPWVPGGGWPIAYEEFERYVKPAAELCELPSTDFAAAVEAVDLPALYRAPFVDGDIIPVIWYGSPPTRFGRRYREELSTAPNIRTLLHSTVVELETDPDGGRVESVRIVTNGGATFRVRARTFVLTAGAIHTARILLASTGVHASGIGNHHDNVGRYFMEHPHVPSARIHLFERNAALRPFIPALDSVGVRGAIARLSLLRPNRSMKVAYTLTAEVKRQHELLAFSAHLNLGDTQAQAQGTDQSEPDVSHSLRLILTNLRSMPEVISQLRRGTLPAGAADHLKNVLLKGNEAARILADTLLRKPAHLELYVQSEQSPNRNSRVTLSDERDAAGLPRARLDWRLSELDRESIRRSQSLIGERLEQQGVGRLEPLEWVETAREDWGRVVRGGHHHMGTARMSASPRQGVTDPESRIHGVPNLYVADAAAFPAVGFANPMLTSVALALRTADHVRASLASRVELAVD